MLDIINPIPKNNPQQIQKLRERPWEDLPGDGLNEIPKIIPAVEGDVSDIVIAQQSRRHHQLREARCRDAVLANGLEVDPLVAEEVDRVGSVIVARNVEIAEIKLPDEAAVGVAEVGEVPERVRERDPHLNELESVDVRFQNLVALERVRVGAVVADDDAGELGVHGDEGISID